MMPMTSGAKLNVAHVARPPSRAGRRKLTAETTFIRGVSTAGKLLLVWTMLVIGLDIGFSLLCAPALKLIKQIIDGKAHRSGFFDKPVDELFQVFFVFFVMICGEMAGAHKRSPASSCFEDAGAFQLGIDLGDRVGIHAQLHGQLSYSWQLLPDP